MQTLILQRLKKLFINLSQKQRVALISVSVFTLVSMFLLLVWANRPEYALLYSNLDAGDASRIIDDLKTNGIPYKLKDGGNTVLVPKQDIYELRIKYAGQNLISSGAVGYELFDKNNLGLTDFMQKVNLKRALEGELTNTINQIESVVQSRVHLVMPEPALFENEKRQSTAAIVLKLRPHTQLDKKQVMGITHLVAGSVEGLEPENVIIIDTFGKVLSKKGAQDDIIGLSSSQYELQQNVEKYLTNKAQTMLDIVLGNNNSIVRVSATLDFEKVRRTTESVDPEKTAILSEERNEETSTSKDTTLFKRENTITNYEMNKVVEQYESSLGDIKQLSIAVFINGTHDGNGQYVPRSDDEINKITEIVKSAVGFSANRNDHIVVQQQMFDTTLLDRETEMLNSLENKEDINRYMKLGLVVFGIAFVLFVLRSMLKKIGFDEYVKKQRELLLEESNTSLNQLTGEQKISEAELAEKVSEDVKARAEAQEKIKNEVKSFTEMDSERAATILRYWLVQED